MPSTHYGTFPILLPGKTETVSRNGLKKTTGTILCLPGQEDDAISLAESYGSVYPEASTRTTDMGLVEVSFDAYESAGSPKTTRGTLVVTLSKTFDDAETSWTVVETWFVDTFTTFTTVSAVVTSSAISAPTPSLSRSLKRRTTIGRRGIGGANSLTLTWTTAVSDLTRRNFGDIDEVDITYGQTATIE